MDVRVAFITDGVAQLISQLDSFLKRAAKIDGCFKGTPKSDVESALRGEDEDLQDLLRKWLAKGRLSKLAELWVNGLSFDWARLQGGVRPCRVSLPTYPFARERHWVSEMVHEGAGQPGSRRGSEVLHPLVHENRSDFAGQRYATRLSGDEFFLRDHVVGGNRVLPGAAHLELARAAIELALGGEDADGIRLESVVFLRPVLVGVAGLELHIDLEIEEDASIGFRIHGAIDKEDVVYSQGRALVGVATSAPAVIDIDNLRSVGEERSVDASRCYATFAAMGVACGATMRALREVRVGNDSAGPFVVGELRLPDEVAAEGDVLHPSLLDAAMQSGIWLTFGAGEWAQDRAALLFSLDRMEIVSLWLKRARSQFQSGMRRK